MSQNNNLVSLQFQNSSFKFTCPRLNLFEDLNTMNTNIQMDTYKIFGYTVIKGTNFNSKLKSLGEWAVKLLSHCDMWNFFFAGRHVDIYTLYIQNSRLPYTVLVNIIPYWSRSTCGYVCESPTNPKKTQSLVWYDQVY